MIYNFERKTPDRAAAEPTTSQDIMAPKPQNGKLRRFGDVPIRTAIRTWSQEIRSQDGTILVTMRAEFVGRLGAVVSLPYNHDLSLIGNHNAVAMHLLKDSAPGTWVAGKSDNGTLYYVEADGPGFTMERNHA